MSKRVHIDETTGASRDVASDKGIYIERASSSATLTAPTTSYTAPAWLSVPWTTKAGDLNVVLSGSDIILPVAGKYLVTWTGPTGSVDSIKQLRAQAVSGCTMYGYNTNYGANRSPADQYSNGVTFVVDASQDNAAFVLQYYSSVSNSLSSLRACIVQLNVSVPYLVAQGNGVVSDNRQRYVKIHEDLTMSVNSSWRNITDWKTKFGYVEAESAFKPGTGDQICVVKVHDVAQKIRIHIHNDTTQFSSPAGGGTPQFMRLTNLFSYVEYQDCYVSHYATVVPNTTLPFNLLAWNEPTDGIVAGAAITNGQYLYLVIEVPIKPGAPLL
jgi:hypothetical protein